MNTSELNSPEKSQFTSFSAAGQQDFKKRTNTAFEAIHGNPGHE